MLAMPVAANRDPGNRSEALLEVTLPLKRRPSRSHHTSNLSTCSTRAAHWRNRMAGTWTTFSAPDTSTGTFTADVMILLTDGSLLVHNGFVSDVANASQWLR